MGIILWIVLGGLAGWIASIVMKTDSNQGLPGDIILGIVGGLLGGFIMSFFGQPGVTGFNLYSMLVAVIGAIAAVSVAKMFRHA